MVEGTVSAIATRYNTPIVLWPKIPNIGVGYPINVTHHYSLQN